MRQYTYMILQIMLINPDLMRKGFVIDGGDVASLRLCPHQ